MSDDKYLNYYPDKSTRSNCDGDGGRSIGLLGF